MALNSTNGEAPEWINVLPAGVITTRDGRGPYTVADMAALATHSLKTEGGKLPVDENHSTDYAAPQGAPSPARGWIVELQARGDGMWGRVDWNASGKALFSERAYRGISPVFEHDKSGRVLRLLRASLTNTPNLRDLVSLHSEGANMDLLVELRKLLGLADDADAAAVIAKVKELQGGGAAATQAAALREHLSSIAAAAGAAANAEPAVVLNAVKTLAATAATKDGGEVVKTLQSELQTLATSHNALLASTAKERATHFVDEAIKQGRVGVKPLRDHYIEQHAKDPARVEKEIGAFAIVETITTLPRGSAHAITSDADPTALAAQATDYQNEMAKKGQTVDYATAVNAVAAKKQEQKS